MTNEEKLKRIETLEDVILEKREFVILTKKKTY